MKQIITVDITKPLTVPFDGLLSGIYAPNMIIHTCYESIRTGMNNTFMTVVRKNTTVYFIGGNEKTKIILEEFENQIK